jgi:hypothetical protein
MELIGLTNDFVRVKTLQCTNIQWNRRYYEPGDYMLELLAEDWDTSIAYIYTPDRPETGMVQKIESENTAEGDFVLVSGYFLEGMLNWKVTWPEHKSTDNVCAACKSLVTSLMEDTEVTVADEADLGGSEAFDSEKEKLGAATYAALKKQELGQRILFDYDTETMTYSVWQGLDRTQNQSENTYATFAQNFGNVNNLVLTQDSSAMHNFAIVQYYKNGDEQTMEIDLREGDETKRILWINSSVYKDDDETDAEFLDAVESDAREIMEDYEAIENVAATVLQHNLYYLKDYDLGDKCYIRDDRMALEFEARIIEVDEVWKENQHIVIVEFGNRIPTTND